MNVLYQVKLKNTLFLYKKIIDIATNSILEMSKQKKFEEENEGLEAVATLAFVLVEVLQNFMIGAATDESLNIENITAHTKFLLDKALENSLKRVSDTIETVKIKENIQTR